MVDRVGNGPGYGYPQINEKKVNTGATGTGEKFRLDYGKEGAIYEPGSDAVKKQQAEKKTTSQLTNAAKAEEEGVRLTLSGSAPNTLEQTKNADTAQSASIIDAVTTWVNKIIEGIKGLFSSIWNDETSEKVEETPEKVEETPETKSETKPKTQFEKAKAEAEAFLTSAEGKKIARNTDLLTYYDKHGTVISVSPSDRQRILYGDKNQIEV